MEQHLLSGPAEVCFLWWLTPVTDGERCICGGSQDFACGVGLGCGLAVFVFPLSTVPIVFSGWVVLAESGADFAACSCGLAVLLSESDSSNCRRRRYVPGNYAHQVMKRLQVRVGGEHIAMRTAYHALVRATPRAFV
jgi:hypothetical protein